MQGWEGHLLSLGRLLPLQEPGMQRWEGHLLSLGRLFPLGAVSHRTRLDYPRLEESTARKLCSGSRKVRGHL